MYAVYTKAKDEWGKDTLHYHGLKKSIKRCHKILETRKGYIKDYNTKQVVFQNMI